MRTLSTPTQNQARMASFLNLAPDMPETWPMETLDYLIYIERRDGSGGLYREIGRLLNPHFRG